MSPMCPRAFRDSHRAILGMSRGDAYEIVKKSSADRTIHLGSATGATRRPFSSAA